MIEKQPNIILPILPSSKIKSSLKPIFRWLSDRSLLLQTEYLPSPQTSHPYLSEPDPERSYHLCQALSEPSQKVVWMVRGGFGLTRILDSIEKIADQIPCNKTVVGYSDGTALLQLLYQKRKGELNLYHAPLLKELPNHPQGSKILTQILADQPSDLTLSPLSPPPSNPLPLLGGNLCVLASLCGTPHQPSFHNCFLLLEDVKEPDYKIDRYLTQLAHSGSLGSECYLLEGQWTDCSPKASDTFRQRCQELGINLIGKVAIGHGPNSSYFKFGHPYLCQGERLKPC